MCRDASVFIRSFQSTRKVRKIREYCGFHPYIWAALEWVIENRKIRLIDRSLSMLETRAFLRFSRKQRSCTIKLVCFYSCIRSGIFAGCKAEMMNDNLAGCILSDQDPAYFPDRLLIRFRYRFCCRFYPNAPAASAQPSWRYLLYVKWPDQLQKDQQKYP